MTLLAFLTAEAPAPDLKGLEQFTIDLLQKIETGVIKYTPDALKLILATYRVSALARLLVSGIGCLVLTLIAFRLLPWTWKNIDHWSHEKQGYTPAAAEVAAPFFMAFFCITYAVIVVWFLNTWLNVWDWIAAFHPELALVHDIIRKFLGGTY